MADFLMKAPYQYEPLRKNRFQVRFPTDIAIQPWALASGQLPRININKVSIPLLNTSTYVAGRYEWGEISMVIRDFIAPSQSQAIMEWVRLHAESVTGRMGYNVGAAKDIEIEMLDPTNVVVQSWRCEKCIIVGDVQFSDLSYDDDALSTINLTVQPQYCVLKY